MTATSHKALSLLLVLAASLTAHSQDNYPTSGFLYGVKEKRSLSYECDLQSDGTLDCEFIQSGIRQKKTDEKIREEMAKADEQYKELIADKKEFNEFCKSMREMLVIVDGGPLPPTISDRSAVEKYLSNTRRVDRDRLVYQSADSFCTSPSIASFRVVMSHIQENEKTTCVITHDKFSQQFKRLKGSETWVTSGPPQGACGVVQLSRFEEKKIDGLTSKFWVYTSRKAVTNPTGKVDLLLGTMKCSDLDEDEYLYDWAQKDIPLHCETIEFSVL
jgi:hypothetical protein